VPVLAAVKVLREGSGLGRGFTAAAVRRVGRHQESRGARFVVRLWRVGFGRVRLRRQPLKNADEPVREGAEGLVAGGRHGRGVGLVGRGRSCLQQRSDPSAEMVFEPLPTRTHHTQPAGHLPEPVAVDGKPSIGQRITDRQTVEVLALRNAPGVAAQHPATGRVRPRRGWRNVPSEPETQASGRAAAEYDGAIFEVSSHGRYLLPEGCCRTTRVCSTSAAVLVRWLSMALGCSHR